MDNAMREDWNNTIDPTDMVYILGDVSFNNGTQAVDYIRSLNGRKILIQGNHDEVNLRNPDFKACFEDIHVYHEIYHNKTKVCMFHYPLLEWNKMHYGSVHLHGHVHGKVSGLEKLRVRDVGYDATGRIAVEMEVIVKYALMGQIKTHH